MAVTCARLDLDWELDWTMSREGVYSPEKAHHAAGNTCTAWAAAYENAETVRGRGEAADVLPPLEQALYRHAFIPTKAELSHVRTATSTSSSASQPPAYEVVFEESENPKKWPLWYRGWVLFVASFSSWVVILYSTVYTVSMPELMKEFGVWSSSTVTLGVTVYLVGLGCGSVLVAPLSELFGRRRVYLVCLCLFTLLIIPCAKSARLVVIIVARFFGALFGAAMIGNSSGTVMDIADPNYLSLYMSLWGIAPLNGPFSGPLIGGITVQYLGWRWCNWLSLILGGVGTVCMLTVKETYAPVLLQKKAARKRREEADERWRCHYDQALSGFELFKANMRRPFVLAFTEPILCIFNIWISIVYAVLYLSFVAYPIVFVHHRGWSHSQAGLAFAGIGAGAMLAIVLEPVWRRVVNACPKDPDTGRAAPEATAFIMIIGAILAPIGQLIFAWTCLPATIHWAMPVASGVPFGMGNTLVYIYGSNYLAGCYGIYTPSALAGTTFMRYLFGGTLLLAGPSVYAALTPRWAGTMLGLLELLLIPIPVVLQRRGNRIRAKSKLIRQTRKQ